jgi:steroid delta-isomerase-like uncharacterized protein
MSVAENKAIVRRWFEEVWNKGNLDAVDELVAATVVSEIPGEPEVRGPEAWRQQVSSTRAAFPDLAFTIEDQIAEEDKVATRWTLRGTHQGEFMGVPATGKQVTVTGISITRYANGKNVGSWNEMDLLGLMQQLGAIAPVGG